MPEFSIIISVYNKEKHIKETLLSVLHQSHTDFEVIIVNDASTDGSDEAIKPLNDKRIKYFPLEINGGAGAARNKGIMEASGEYIALLDGDDLWDASYLAEIKTLIEEFPAHRVFATSVFVEDRFETAVSNYSFDNPKNKKFIDLDYFESSAQNTILTSSSTVIHHSVFNEIGNYDQKIKSGQDTDLWIRIGLKYRVAFSVKPLVTYRYAPQSLFKSIRSVTDRPDFLKYIDQEKESPALKKFIDLNRYSLAIRSKLWNESHLTQIYTEHIDRKNLNSKQRFVLSLPAPLLKLGFRVNGFLEKIGLRQSAF